MSSRYHKSSVYIRFKTEYYYSWYCAKKVYKNIKWHDNQHRLKNRNNTLMIAPRSYLGTIRYNPNGFRCRMECKSLMVFNDKYVCIEGKSIRAEWVEKNL